MRVLALVGVVQTLVTGAATAADLPLWAYLVVWLVGSGGGLAWLNYRTEKRIASATAGKTEAEAGEAEARRQRIVDDLEERALSRVDAQFRAMELELQETKTALAETQTDLAQTQTTLAKKDAENAKLLHKVALLMARIDKFNDQLLAYEQGEEYGKRHADADGPAE